MKIRIDPGHGGTDPGAINGGKYEKDIVLAIALNLGARLAAHGFETGYTRTTDRDITLKERVAMSNAAADNLFISVHADAANDKIASGITSYIIARGGNAEKAATLIQNALIAATKAADRGVRTANFEVLRETKCPAVLVETGFITNDAEAAKLTDPAYQDLLARAITQGICQFANVAYDPQKGAPEAPTQPQQPLPEQGKTISVDELKKMGYTNIVL